jgi:predicted RNA-binding protein YlqC (UPF0109 family)
MKELIEFLAKNIASKPGEVKVEEDTVENRQVVKLSVANEDMGKIIGKSGRIIKALRTLLKIKAIRNNKRAYLELVEQDTLNE